MKFCINQVLTDISEEGEIKFYSQNSLQHITLYT